MLNMKRNILWVLIWTIFISNILLYAEKSTTNRGGYNEGGYIEREKQIDSQEGKLEAYLKFTKVVQLVEEQYVETLNAEEIIQKALIGMLEHLDSHSSFFKENEYKTLSNSYDNNISLASIGINVQRKNHILRILPITNSPSAKSGLQADDILLEINNILVLGKKVDEVIPLLLGKENTVVSLKIYRERTKKLLDIKIKRKILKDGEIFSKKLNHKILYIQLRGLGYKVTDKIRKILNDNNDTQGIVLDLRDNPGGLLNEAIGISDLFLEKGMIISQKGQVAEENLIYNASKKGTFKNIPMVLIVNKGTSSGTEIIAGALKEQHRAIILGEKTFGKGTIQVIMPIGSEEYIRLTIAKLYLANGKRIEGLGITPNIYVEDRESQMKMAIDTLTKMIKKQKN